MIDHAHPQREGASKNTKWAIHALMTLTNQQAAILRDHGVCETECQRAYDAIQNVLMLAAATARKPDDAGSE